MIGHLLVFDRPLIRRIEAVVFGGDPLDDHAIGVEQFIEHRLGPLGFLVALVGDVELFGLEFAEDVARPAAGDGADHVVFQLEVAARDVLQNVRRFLGVDAVGDDHIETDVVAVHGLEQQVIAKRLIPAPGFVGHLHVLQLGVKHVPVVEDGGKEIDRARRIHVVLYALLGEQAPLDRAHADLGGAGRVRVKAKHPKEQH